MNNQIDSILLQSKSVAIVGHINPDGDCFGSLSAVNDYIKSKFNCLVHCFAECTTIAEEFKPFVEDITFNPEPLQHYDTCICVDTADIGRLGEYVDIFNNSDTTICIDHHSTNAGFAQLNIVNLVSSNCENIYILLRANNFVIQKSTAGKLFAGLITDTNNFSTNSVTSQTYLVASELQQLGVDCYRIKNFFFGGNTMPQFNMLHTAMQSATFYNHNSIMAMKITADQMQYYGATQEDLNPIINQAFCMKHALCALLITPRNHMIHVSLRAKNEVDVSLIAKHFDGGGHKAAAAFTVDNFNKEDFDYIISELSAQINNLPKIDEKLF